MEILRSVSLGGFFSLFFSPSTPPISPTPTLLSPKSDTPHPTRSTWFVFTFSFCFCFCFCFPLQKRASLQEMAAKYGKATYNKTRRNPSYGGLTRQSGRRKKLSRTGKGRRDIPPPTVSSQTKIIKLITITYMQKTWQRPMQASHLSLQWANMSTAYLICRPCFPGVLHSLWTLQFFSSPLLLDSPRGGTQSRLWIMTVFSPHIWLWNSAPIAICW